MFKKIFGSVILSSWVYIFWALSLRNDYPSACIPIGIQELTNICEATAQYLLVFVPMGVFFVILAIWNNEIYKKWEKFTLIFLGLYFIIFFVLTPTDAPDFVPFYKETVAIWGMILYAVISMVHIAYLKLKKI